MIGYFQAGDLIIIVYLKEFPKETLLNDIKNGKSITLCYPEEKIYTSAIVGGIIPMALGCALGIKKKMMISMYFYLLVI